MPTLPIVAPYMAIRTLPAGLSLTEVSFSAFCVIYSGISIWTDSYFVANTLGKLIACMLLTYGFCYLYYIRNKRYIRIIRFKQLDIMQIITTILYVIITVITFIGILYIERNKL